MTATSSNTEQKKACCTPARPQAAIINPHPDLGLDLVKQLDTLAGYARDERCPIPAGTAYIGTDSPMIEVDEEAPLRQGKIKAFSMDKGAVTNGRFAQFVLETGYRTEAEKLGDSFVFHHFLPSDLYQDKAVAGAPWWRMVEGACWHQPFGPNGPALESGTADHPVVHISHHDAEAFAAWAGGRLPTEAEWEHAARGGLGDVFFPWGDHAPDEEDYTPCNIWQGTFPDQDSGRDGYTGTAPVYAFAPNGYGLHQMVGNVWEWTAQHFKLRSRKKQLREIHQDKVGYRIVKGGSYLCHISYCYRYRIAARTANSPDSSTGHTGFRLIYDLPL